MSVSEAAIADKAAFAGAAPPVAGAQAWPDKITLNSLRGLACLLLVAFHVSEAYMNRLGATLPWLVNFHEVMEPVRMPLFSFLSGFIYGLRPVEPGTVWGFEAKKVRRLLVPFVCVTVLIYAMKFVVPSERATLDSFGQYLVYPSLHLWFLQALFIVFLIYAVVDSRLPGARPLGALLVFAVSLVLYLSPLRQITAFSIGDAFYILPFFGIGVLACRFRAAMAQWSAPLTAVLGVAVALFLVYAFRTVFSGGAITKYDPVILAMSLSSVLLLLLVFPRVGWLARIGAYSYAIYLFHTIFTSLAARFAPDQAWLALPLVMLAATAGPIAVEIVITRWLPVFGFVIGRGFGRARAGGGD